MKYQGVSMSVKTRVVFPVKSVNEVTNMQYDLKKKLFSKKGIMISMPILGDFTDAHVLLICSRK